MMTVMYNFLNFRRLTLVFLSSVLLLHCASSELWPRHMCAAHTPAASTHNPTEMPLWRWLLPPHPLLSFSTAAVRYMWLGDHKTLCRLLWDLQCKKQLGTSVARRVFNCGSSLLRDASPQPHAVRRLAVFFWHARAFDSSSLLHVMFRCQPCERLPSQPLVTPLSTPQRGGGHKWASILCRCRSFQEKKTSVSRNHTFLQNYSTGKGLGHVARKGAEVWQTH